MTTDALLHAVLGALWLAWLAYWVLAARSTKAAAWREPWPSRARHMIPLSVAALLFALPQAWPSPLDRRFVPTTATVGAIAVACVALGLGFAAWARIHLGRNWSAQVEVKAGHTLIQSGPYALVRHPIYSGVILAFVGTALSIGEWRGLLAVAFATIALAFKASGEDHRMEAAFANHGAYRRRTPAFVPFLQ